MPARAIVAAAKWLAATTEPGRNPSAPRQSRKNTRTVTSTVSGCRAGCVERIGIGCTC